MIWLVLIANWLRQVSYYVAYRRYGHYEFCESTETLWFMKQRKWWIGYLEEVGFFLLWLLFWRIGLRFLMYGWLFDAFQDVAIAAFWPRIKLPKYNIMQTNVIREVVIPYLIMGPLLAFFALPVEKLSLIVVVAQLFMIAYLLQK